MTEQSHQQVFQTDGEIAEVSRGKPNEIGDGLRTTVEHGMKETTIYADAAAGGGV
jgi:hypothetical protein